MSNFGSRLKQLRNEMKLTQIGLAEKVGINYSTISDYERGDKTDPFVSTLKIFANFFSVSLDYMTGDSDIREDISNEKLCKMYAQLNNENKLKLISYAEFLRSEQK